jgi:response regulator of citrate/malate metabolism
VSSGYSLGVPGRSKRRDGPRRAAVNGAWLEVGVSSVVSVLVIAVDRTAARAQAAYVNRLPGFRTTATVGSAAAGVRRLAKGGIDLVLMDRTLPDGDGAALAAQWREEGFAGAVVLTAAAFDGVESAAASRPAGVVGELIRPFTFDEFRHTLLSWAASRPVAEHPAGRVPTRRGRAARSGVPSGMRPDTLDAITVVVRESCGDPTSAVPADEQPGLTASAVATVLGAPRLTVRRYLDHLADAGVLVRSLKRRAVGRPEAMYRPVAQRG